MPDASLPLLPAPSQTPARPNITSGARHANLPIIAGVAWRRPQSVYAPPTNGQLPNIDALTPPSQAL